MTLLADPNLTRFFQIDGILFASSVPHAQRSLAEAVSGREVTTVHSEASKGKPAILGMWMLGEVIAAQKLLLGMGAQAVHSIVLCRRGDRAVSAALRRYASFEVSPVDS